MSNPTSDKKLANAPTQVTKELLDEMILYNYETSEKISVGQLSQQHKVLLVFLRHFQCIYCQATILKIAAHHQVLLQLNTIPVLIHQESKENAEKFFETHKGFATHQPIVSQMLRVQDPKGNETYGKFDLGLASFRTGELPLPTLITRASMLQRTPYGISNQVNPKDRRADKNQMPGLFLIENGQVSNMYKYKTIADNPQFLQLIIDPDEIGCTNDSFCDMSSRINRFARRRAKVEDSTSSETTVASTAVENGKAQTTTSQEIELDTTQQSSDDSQPVIKEKKILGDPWKGIPEGNGSNNNTNNRSLFGCFCSGSSSSADNDFVMTDELRNQIQMQDVLNHLKAYKYFKLYCASEFSVENLLLLEAVNQYKAQSNEEQRMIQSKQIFDTFFTSGCPNEINTTRRLINETLEKRDKSGPVLDLFDKIMSTVESEQMSDTFLRFKKTSDFELAAKSIIKNKKWLREWCLFWRSCVRLSEQSAVKRKPIRTLAEEFLANCCHEAPIDG